MNVDVDKLLGRKLYLQRFVTSLFDDVREMNAPGDKQLIAAINEFVLDADEKTLAALSQRRSSNPDARALVTTIRSTVKQQQIDTANMMSDQMGQLIDREIAVTASALGEANGPSSRGVASLPVAGMSQSEIIAAAYALYASRLMAEVTKAAGTGRPNEITKIIRGSKPENFRDGLFYWRDERLMRPNIDQIVNGQAANAANHTYKAFYVEKVDHLATLDFRTCPRCFAAERNGPYELGKQPAIPVHPRCRCVNIPSFPEDPPERPYVKDDRSVKNIPKDERDGKIGQTRDSIDKFFDRMTDADRIAYMGPTRAKLWKQGKIDDIRDLVNQRTLQPLRLDELPEAD